MGLVVLRGYPDCLSTPLGEVALQEKMGQRFFFAGCSFSHVFYSTIKFEDKQALIREQ